MLGAIRLRWWADAVGEIFAGRPPRAHEVCAPLAEAIRGSGLPRAPFDAMIAAREWDCGREAFAGPEALERYLEATGGRADVARGRALGAAHEAEGPARDLGRAAGAAAWLRALGRLSPPGGADAGGGPGPGGGGAGQTTPALAAAVGRAGAGGARAAGPGAGGARARSRGRRVPALLPAAGTRRRAAEGAGRAGGGARRRARGLGGPRPGGDAGAGAQRAMVAGGRERGRARSARRRRGRAAGSSRD